MSQMKQLLNEIKQTHEQEIAELRASHARQLRQQAALYRDRMRSLEMGLEHERRIQAAVFEEGILHGLCSHLIENYDSEKYPPNMHTLLSALTGEIEREDLEKAAHSRQIPCHHIAAFRDTITDGPRSLGGVLVDGLQGLEEPEEEIEELKEHVVVLHKEYKELHTKLCRYRNEVRFRDEQVKQQHSALARLAVGFAEAQRMIEGEKQDFLRLLQQFGTLASVMDALVASSTLEKLWHDARKQKHALTGKHVQPAKRRLENETAAQRGSSESPEPEVENNHDTG